VRDDVEHEPVREQGPAEIDLCRRAGSGTPSLASCGPAVSRVGNPVVARSAHKHNVDGALGKEDKLRLDQFHGDSGRKARGTATIDPQPLAVPLLGTKWKWDTYICEFFL
jgi:hypothetical protein